MSAPVLALDLARHPSGATVADVVDRSLTLRAGLLREAGVTDTADAEAVASRAAARRRLQALADRAPRMAAALREATAAASSGFEPGSLAAASSVLQTALVGRLPDLLALLRRELIGALVDDVVDLAVDRVVAAWTADQEAAGAEDVRLLRERWDRLVPDMPPLPPATPDGGHLLDLLEAVARCDAGAWRALDREHEKHHAGLGWSALVHAATRGVVENGRTLDAARWQLSAVRAVAAAGHVRTTCAPGAMMSVTAAVQALCSRDNAPDDVTERLLAPCRSVFSGVC